MRYFVEMLGVLLVGAGLFILGWLLLGRLLAPIGMKGPIVAVLPAAGDGSGLEHDLRGLLWLRGSGMACLRVVIADCGLNEEGRKLARLLSRQEADVICCPAHGVGELLQGPKWADHKNAQVL